ncbi:hypothetical protein, partial [Microbacterium sp. IEGM 1404]|uniref:hypothetical protein n=1 Tax=Microbacterium sp. IEGM 1404 TaxID=3047084 RepID=UPI0024B6EB53
MHVPRVGFPSMRVVEVGEVAVKWYASRSWQPRGHGEGVRGGSCGVLDGTLGFTVGKHMQEPDRDESTTALENSDW